MIKAAELVQMFRTALDEKWGYIWGKRGQVWTQAAQDAATREMTVKYGQQWVGRKVADCSGLFVWAHKQFGETIYHGSNTIFNKYTSETGALTGEVSIKPGTAVFLVDGGDRHHIGLYVGEGKVIEARGTRTGVVESELERWDEWGTLKDVDYEGVTADVAATSIKTMRRGDQGLSVTWLQQALIQAGFGVGEKGADGIFGSATEKAVKAFQTASGLEADGIAGKKTINALTNTQAGASDETPENDEPTGTDEKGDAAWAGMTVEEKLDDLNERLEKLEEGDTHGESA